jgi:hypothetical protein
MLVTMPLSSSRMRSMLAVCMLGGAGLACTQSEPGKTEESRAEPCSSDADCTLHCTQGCCAPSCPCATAISTDEAARREEQSRRDCGDRKMTCPIEDRDACEWNARFRATCSSGSCVAEAIDGGAVPELRAPPTPERYAVTDEECRLCRQWDDRRAESAGACTHLVEWPCASDQSCRMKVPCDAACCELRPTEEIGLDAAPWGPHTQRSSKPSPPPGLLVAVGRPRGETASGGRLLFATPRPAGMIETDVEVSSSASVAWIHGTHDVVLGGSSLERMSFPSRERVRLAEGIHTVMGLDVSPTGDRVAFAGPSAARDARLAVVDGSLVVLDLRTHERTSLTAAAGDAHPRWSPDGARLVFQGRREPGRLGVVELASGRMEETRMAEAFMRPLWHPSGKFLLAWLERSGTCRLVLVTPDRLRFAPTGLEVAARSDRGYSVDVCGDLAISPNGTHVAFWRQAGEDDELMMASLAWTGAQVGLGTMGIGGAIDWTDGVRMEELALAGAAGERGAEE